ncbi:DUF2894 domain-containing protein [Parahaliea sp. F7430]|uniref:DUF2894 domain-containing protein n=1 Tax=Sediminihaliea albiluteola TaxID=2758564 RepID=A0A7W2YI56_9GAMM|nr:DUF2894 domain-containing protein [Sediminihaliea albiluteola]MBA6412161.1 DUF2894 domain-containing protein [Sediminihaliea albiluteola]
MTEQTRNSEVKETEPVLLLPSEIEIPELDKTDVQSLSALIVSLRERGLQAFAPIRFAAIQALVKRLEQAGDQAALSSRLQSQAVTGLNDYIQGLLDTREQVQSQFTELLQRFPEAESELRRTACTFDQRALQRLQRRLERQRSSGPLAQLTAELSELSELATGLPSSEGFSTDLQAQEKQLLAEYQAASLPRAELRSAQRYRQAMLRVGAEQLVNQAQAQLPADSGPLNPQRLATRSITLMHQLSASYTARFVSYIDTLFYLESQPKD